MARTRTTQVVTILDLGSIDDVRSFIEEECNQLFAKTRFAVVARIICNGTADDACFMTH